MTASTTPSSPPAGLTLEAEDTKLVVLARAARLRAYTPGGQSAEGAAVRDTDGRTYAAATVGHSRPDLATSALRAAVVAAASSGARRFEAAVVVTEAAAVGTDDLAMLAEFGAGVPVYLAGPDGVARTRTSS
ncbi:cytidine deaminase [Frankia sp. EI5c]|uniref:cytidine deaminase n=1 Tax=Frankia sp. EI5c TaxID=683316 RepID=UPI0007C385E2|nr:cytidine deaminase [Frankia sp. EI5c]OAA28047.1 cytidine deaminase [Frankia sp. EI5c]